MFIILFNLSFTVVLVLVITELLLYYSFIVFSSSLDHHRLICCYILGNCTAKAKNVKNGKKEREREGGARS